MSPMGIELFQSRMDDLMVSLMKLETLNSNYARSIVKDYAVEHSQDPILEPPSLKVAVRYPHALYPARQSWTKAQSS